MPTAVFDKGREGTKLVFDTWADVGQGVLLVRWDCDIDDEAGKLFAELAANLGYLGRSESWVQGEALPDDGGILSGCNAYPHVEGQRPGHGWEQVSLIAAESAKEYREWRDASVTTELLQERAKVEEPYPADILACLQRDTAWWKEHRWSQPPGARRVLYWRRTDALEVGPAPARRVTVSTEPVEAMLLALAPQSGNLHSLPDVARSVPQAELLHRALVSHATKSGTHCESLIGRTQGGAPLADHRHAHLIPLDLDGDGHLDHVLVWAPMLLDDVAQAAVRAVRRTFMKGGAADLRVALAGLGSRDVLRNFRADIGVNLKNIVGPVDGASEWVSQTPFVAPRFLKKRGKNTLQGQIESELAARHFPPAEIVLLEARDEINMRFRHFIMSRRSGPEPPQRLGVGVRLRFERPVNGPICLGYGSHFGLGRFAAERAT